jgi:hypothetical protein
VLRAVGFFRRQRVREFPFGEAAHLQDHRGVGEPITVPAPIAARGPITAPGSMLTPFSICAEGWTIAPGVTPFDPKSEDGRQSKTARPAR